ncbi:uncharacterized protein LOC103040397 isoform X5 [Astyanax mexicanus]|uniref:uncharacterized protein LOC103040397 isoform X5 n=1 Tax=Astyanax mexicanus TaxID=7994 RepID=UPI0020CB69EF|nr:uncharacterized protein LOC103040397 isoform X5 [Astyanax mexicanus]
MNVLQDLRSGGLYIQDARLGSVGPYPLYMESFETLVECNKVSDEIMDALFHLFSMKRPGILAINAHTLSHILDGGARARSHYFIKRNIFKNTREVIGPYLEHGNHWTFFHCSFVDRTITYLNSLGEQDQQYDKIKNNWSTFAAAKGYHGPWKRTTRNHSLQSDSISCGVFTAVFAETFLEGEEGYLTCPPVHEERQRLGLLLFKSLDRSGVCGICHKTVSKKSKDKCLTCLANIHAKCLPVNPEDSKCLFCKGQLPNPLVRTPPITSNAPTHQEEGFIVESVLKVSDFHQTKRYLVTTDELQRRCAQPESYSANTVVAYLRKAKGQKRNIEQKLAELEVNPSKRTKLTSLCSKLCEDECRDLADDITYLAAKFIPQKKVGQALLEDGNVHEGMAKTEDCRKTLKAVEKALETNWHTFDLATHGLGPAVIKGTFELIDACLKEKIKALQS